MAGSDADLLTEAYAALDCGDPDLAVQRFEAACSRDRSGAALEGLGLAHYLRTDYRAATAAHEGAYVAYRGDGDRLAAARVARTLAWINGNVFGEWAVRAGWMARARTLLAHEDAESAEHGWVLMLDAQTEPDSARKLQWYRQARQLGSRFGDPALEIEALGWLGLQTALEGDVDAGLRVLDEALAAVVSGEVKDLYVVEGTFCGLFWACERFHDVARAEQWVRAAESLQRRHLVGMAGFCRAHYGGILTAAGRWAEADEQLSEAARLFERGYSALKASVEVRLAELRVLQGREEEARQLLDAVGDHPDAARPLAMLHLAEGRTALAREVLERKLDEAGLDHDVAAPLWGLLVDVQLAEDDLEGAARSVARLESIAAERPSVPFVVGTAALARGRLCLAGHEPGAAACLREALAVFTRSPTPVHVAHVHLDLARALSADKPDVAVAEATAASTRTVASAPIALLAPPRPSCVASGCRHALDRRAGISLSARARCSICWLRVCRTSRSPRGSTSAARRSSTTSAGCSPSSAFAIGPRPPATSPGPGQNPGGREGVPRCCRPSDPPSCRHRRSTGTTGDREWEPRSRMSSTACTRHSTATTPTP